MLGYLTANRDIMGWQVAWRVETQTAHDNPGPHPFVGAFDMDHVLGCRPVMRYVEAVRGDGRACKLHPGTHSAPERIEDGSEICGCATLSELLEWFPSVVGRRAMKGFVIRKYFVPPEHFKRDHMQVVFSPARVVVSEVRDIETLINTPLTYDPAYQRFNIPNGLKDQAA